MLLPTTLLLSAQISAKSLPTTLLITTIQIARSQIGTIKAKLKIADLLTSLILTKAIHMSDLN
jgi:hypothetical protein